MLRERRQAILLSSIPCVNLSGKPRKFPRLTIKAHLLADSKSEEQHSALLLMQFSYMARCEEFKQLAAAYRNRARS